MFFRFFTKITDFYRFDLVNVYASKFYRFYSGNFSKTGEKHIKLRSTVSRYWSKSFITTDSDQDEGEGLQHGFEKLAPASPSSGVHHRILRFNSRMSL